jgi:hypothetical protein
LYEEVKICDESKKQYPIFESAEGVFFKKLTFSRASLAGKMQLQEIKQSLDQVRTGAKVDLAIPEHQYC